MGTERSVGPQEVFYSYRSNFVIYSFMLEGDYKTLVNKLYSAFKLRPTSSTSVPALISSTNWLQALLDSKMA